MQKPFRLGMVMDPIQSINIKKDSSFAMLLAAQRANCSLHYMQLEDLSLRDGVCWARWTALHVQDQTGKHFQLGETKEQPMHEAMDAVIMRKDPPFDMEYVYATYLLERAETQGVLVVNKPQALRDANEKLFTAWFPQCCVPSVVSRRAQELKQFIAQQQDVIIKPLGLMGGASIFRVKMNDPNLNVIIENMTQHGREYTLAQRFIPEISEGDKRILIVDGELVPYALARVPTKGETRGNLAAGGEGVGVALNERDQWIGQQLIPTLKQKGLLFVGIDVIGDYLTEVNVTSPTCIRELDALYGLDIAGDLIKAIGRHLS